MAPPQRRIIISTFLVLFLVLTACASGSSDDATDQQSSASVPPPTAPAVEAGSVATGEVEIDGVTIQYVTTASADFELGSEAPLLLAFPPGPQGLDLTLSFVEGTYTSEAQRLGWVVVSPAAPDGTLFFQGSETLMPGFVDWVETWVTPEGGSPHVAGVSNGGISSFRYAALNPDRVRSIVAFPGFPRSEADRAALSEIVDVPIRLYVGGEDTAWIAPAQEAVVEFESLGGDIELTVFPGEGHIIDSTSDGVLIFEQLESFR